VRDEERGRRAREDREELVGKRGGWCSPCEMVQIRVDLPGAVVGGRGTCARCQRPYPLSSSNLGQRIESEGTTLGLQLVRDTMQGIARSEPPEHRTSAKDDRAKVVGYTAARNTEIARRK
jgi:hypothetical protein